MFVGKLATPLDIGAREELGGKRDREQDARSNQRHGAEDNVLQEAERDEHRRPREVA